MDKIFVNGWQITFSRGARRVNVWDLHVVAISEPREAYSMTGQRNLCLLFLLQTINVLPSGLKYRCPNLETSLVCWNGEREET